ncbi:hypothetical protein F442_01891, partial [Phytophthora nicotianae P10297]
MGIGAVDHEAQRYFGGAGRGGLQLVKHDGEELNLPFVMDLCQKARQNLYSGYCRVLHAE